MGRPGRSQPEASAFARAKNSSVQMATTGVPRRSSSMLSWIHLDVHEPQSAMAAATTSHSAMNSSVNRAGDDASLRNQRKLVTPWRPRRSDSTF